MKRMDIFCASPASTAIISGHMEPRRRDGANNILRRQTSVPCSSNLPISPRSRRSSVKQSDFRRKSSAVDDDLRRRTGSARYLLTDHRELVSSELSVKSIDDSVPAPLKLMPSCSNHSREQIVVLKVAIHCKGCEGKVRRHISKMEGVKSFSIELATKKVTIMGDVSPLVVLESVSKVKRAQFWGPSSLHHQTTCN